MNLIQTCGSVRKIFDFVQPFIGLGSLGDQLKIANELPNRTSELMSKDQSGEWSILPLPVLCHRTKSNIMGEYHPSQSARMIEYVLIGRSITSILNGG